MLVKIAKCPLKIATTPKASHIRDLINDELGFRNWVILPNNGQL